MRALAIPTLAACLLAACGNGAQPAEEKSEAQVNAAALRNPRLAKETAPDLFSVRFRTTRGDVVVEVHRDWAPHGADRLYSLVRVGYCEDIAIFRVIKGFMAQFGYHGDPQVIDAWKRAFTLDDETRQSNTRGMVTFAQSGGSDTRTTQLFFNYKDNSYLDPKFPPVGKVVEGMEVVDSFYGGYREQPQQPMIQRQGNAYLRKFFPKLDYIESAVLEE
jgi:peptidyl-prolyl cis-trans isomerase A (cyclophilin A)